MSKKDNKVVTDFEPTLTKQSFKDDCDINKIIAKYRRTGQISHLNGAQPRYIDCVGVSDYQGALEIISSANDQFDALPAKIRARFDNDPAKMLAFCDDPKNIDEAIKLGLIESPKSSEKAPESAPQEAVAPTA